MDKHIHRRQLDKRNLAPKINTLLAESKRFQQKRERRKKKKLSKKLEDQREEILKKTAPVMRELRLYKKSELPDGWVDSHYEKTQEILKILEVRLSPMRFMSTYGAPLSVNKRKRPTKPIMGESIEDIIEEHNEPEEKKIETIEDIHSEAGRLIKELYEDPSDKDKFDEAEKLINTSYEKLNEQARVKKTSKLKRQRREFRVFQEDLAQISLRRYYGLHSDPQWKFTYRNPQEAQRMLEEIENDCEEGRQLVKIMRDKKVEWYVLLEGIDKLGAQLGIITRDLIGGNQLGEGLERRIYGTTFHPHQITSGLMDDDNYRKQYTREVIELFRSEKFYERTKYKTIVMVCDKPKFKDDFIKEMGMIYLYEVKLPQITVHYYAINTQKPYNQKMDVEPIMYKDDIPIASKSLLDFSSPLFSALFPQSKS